MDELEKEELRALEQLLVATLNDCIKYGADDVDIPVVESILEKVKTALYD